VKRRSRIRALMLELVMIEPRCWRDAKYNVSIRQDARGEWFAHIDGHDDHFDCEIHSAQECAWFAAAALIQKWARESLQHGNEISKENLEAISAARLSYLERIRAKFSKGGSR
jgi:hypothetical protein